MATRSRIIVTSSVMSPHGSNVCVCLHISSCQRVIATVRAELSGTGANGRRQQGVVCGCDRRRGWVEVAVVCRRTCLSLFPPSMSPSL